MTPVSDQLLQAIASIAEVPDLTVTLDGQDAPPALLQETLLHWATE